ncbi:MAG: Rieske (2Fe-2S) protein [Gemmatimonadetes bacterium]|uniref:Rieske (2Fe-2S) protein n=1 Tax=Candidatus Kutchimonas denitrificans TaxID=3056748 RepID=A0AAE4ZBB7_9BACT|nr:Rieske (2Fe-2S) protein [Gemmatimonadota bacterium]NIR76107.1 Rieske (2Fe-2S) protein [Candidatus Kutchimonas denitrificans]NIS00486.1 Rieske (2Fe-2S) protein [Gemmatimonadota bacterium]NIT66144.1 Rieske (2Fe-2S) protein [Gemmatimonadota bacterium]NIU54222.1 Rieske 2Fe-2S domain-containing protein [Gemmatimonadota bacterium]
MMERGGRNEQTRRGFVNWILGTGVGGLLLAVLYPVGRYLVPPAAGESAAASVTLDITPAEVTPNSGHIFKFGSRPAILIRTPSGELRAFSAACTHLGCIVQYREDIGHIWCACHNGHFDLNGRNIQGPPPRPLDSFVVNVRGDEIVVSKTS